VYVSVTVYFRAGFFNFRTFSASKWIPVITFPAR
jgi:hypothetical protein